MNRQQLEHILRAAASITGAEELVVIGSQAILGAYPNAPEILLESIEADVFTFRSGQDANLIDGTIGENSPFHQTFGYYAHGVAEETATLPTGWKERLIPVRGPGTAGATGLCLEPHDLAVSKLVAGRDADLAYIAALLQNHLVDPQVLISRIRSTPLDDAARSLCEARVKRLAQVR